MGRCWLVLHGPADSLLSLVWGSVTLQPFLDWIDTQGFHIAQNWDAVKGWVGAGKLSLFPIQRRVLGHCLTPKPNSSAFPYTTVIFSAPKKSGKPLALDTIIPTPDGYTTMGEIVVGDVIFGSDGHPCKVTSVTEVMTGHHCYRIRWANGETIAASEDHLWPVFDQSGRAKLIETGKMIETEGWGHGYMFRSEVAPPLEMEDADLPIPPYLFGIWLGDGESVSGRITCGYEDADEELALIQELCPHAYLREYEDRAPSIVVSQSSRGGSIEKRRSTFGGKLSYLGVRGNKHIPITYLRASRAQRMSLLQGLMDSDGYVSIDGRCEFTTVNARMSRDVQELLATLGYKAHVTEGIATLRGREIGPKFRLHFQAYSDAPVFRLERKKERLHPHPDRMERSSHNSIILVEKIPSVPVRCISVDAETLCFLVGRTLIPTHNTTIAAAVGAWYADEAVPGSEVYVLANDIEQAQVRVYNDISFHLEKSGFTPHKYFMEFPNGTVVRAIAQEYRSAAGGRQGLTLWDELWGYITEKSRRLWAEMTPPPTVPYPLRFIVTYAGFEEESELLWDLYKKVVIDGEPVPELADIVDGKGRPVCWRSKDGGVFAYWDTEPRMPWQTPEYYAEQMGTLRAPEFLRLHKNTWVTSQESFLPIELWDKAVTRGEEAGLTEPLLWKNHPFRNYPIYTAVDIGTKHDASAVVGCYYDFARGRVGVAHHKIWSPEGGDIEGLDLEDTVESYLEQVCLRTLPNAKVIVCDPTQFHRSKITLQKKGLTVTELPQSSTIMVNATENLYDIMRNGVLEAYSASDLRDHLKYAIVEHTGRGYRLAKEKHAKYKIDGAVALAWAAYQAVSTGGVDNRNPIVIRARDSDFTMMKPRHLDDPMAQWLPDAFKTEPTWRQLK